jgi:uncharacterized membrane protein
MSLPKMAIVKCLKFSSCKDTAAFAAAVVVVVILLSAHYPLCACTAREEADATDMQLDAEIQD